ncbi:hypothetical protein FGO68_gene11999 [Halteria grandinella]|uniref:Uncharacterized protein n=1 Tax=Halteria grandinella TaxID=5974 RepID=A0A8J8P081_HALGN|nr:hypothetical protein FGO68_gene11999 [Halteria grandinella]
MAFLNPQFSCASFLTIQNSTCEICVSPTALLSFISRFYLGMVSYSVSSYWVPPLSARKSGTQLSGEEVGIGGCSLTFWTRGLVWTNMFLQNYNSNQYIIDHKQFPCPQYKAPVP